MTTTQLSVACLGLGRIGAGIAQSVQRAGHRLTVYNRTAEKTRSFVASGAKAARSPREAAADAGVPLPLEALFATRSSRLRRMAGVNAIGLC